MRRGGWVLTASQWKLSKKRKKKHEGEIRKWRQREGEERGEERKGEEETRGRGDLASFHPPTLLAAEAQTVCSQQYMHLLVLFQEIITLYVWLCVCVRVCVCECTCVSVCVGIQPKVANELLGGGRQTIWSSIINCMRKEVLSLTVVCDAQCLLSAL